MPPILSSHARRMAAAIAAAMLLAVPPRSLAAGALPAPNPERDAFYGDLHLHTSQSFDAYTFFGARTGPEDAYRFARGEPIDYFGTPARRKLPLDFLAVTDHSEFLGVFPALADPASALRGTDFGKAFLAEGRGAILKLITAENASLAPRDVDQIERVQRSAWQRAIDAANAAYVPGKFTTFVAYEWTSHPSGQNLHRNVVFRGAGGPARPFTAGDSKLSPSDEFANFEIMDHLLGSPQKSRPAGSYARDAYARGLVLEERTGANPYKFGVIGSTDFHSGTSTQAEDAYGGNLDGIDPVAPSTRQASATPAQDDLLGSQRALYGSGALAGVWAERNTREDIFDALRRKETFATSGTRLKFRFFGGWSYGPAALEGAAWVKTAYARGVPMGGDLPARGVDAKAPRFLAWAVKDPDGANLDRLQIVKVWVKHQKHHERIFDVALSDGRKPDASGRVPPIRDTVDVKTATYTNDVGAVELRAIWEDPEFDPAAPAVYYLRVIEIPTPRWSTFHAVRKGVPLPASLPATIQERGWSSPIWYKPRR